MEEFEEFKAIEKRFNEEETNQDKRYLLDGIQKLLNELYQELEENDERMRECQD